MNFRNFGSSIVGLLAVLGTLSLITGCESHHSIRSGTRSDIVVGNQQWSRIAGQGWFGVFYQPEGSEVRIGLSRTETTLVAGSSDDTILQRELMLLRRYADSTISVQGTDRIATDFGSVPVYRLQSSDPDWQLRSLAIFQDTGGQIVNVGFYSARSSVSPKVIRDYLNTMYRGKLIGINRGQR